MHLSSIDMCLRDFQTVFSFFLVRSALVLLPCLILSSWVLLNNPSPEENFYRVSVNQHSHLSQERILFYPSLDEIKFDSDESLHNHSRIHIAFLDALMERGFDIVEAPLFVSLAEGENRYRISLDSLDSATAKMRRLNRSRVDSIGLNELPGFYAVTWGFSGRTADGMRHICTNVEFKIYEFWTVRDAAVGYFIGEEECDNAAQELVNRLVNELDDTSMNGSKPR